VRQCDVTGSVILSGRYRGVTGRTREIKRKSEKGNKRHGDGKVTFDNGDTYQGEWRDGERHERGKSISIPGQRYEGKYIDDKTHDHATDTYANKNTYEGEWRHDQRHGRGKYMWESQIYESQIRLKICEGEWRHDQRHGRGKCTLSDDSRREGEWHNNDKLHLDRSVAAELENV
jgi:hypothetical protein